jgi:hypothetical protein
MAPSKSVRLEVDMPNIDEPPDPHSGLLALHVPEEGRYWVAASGGVWIDIVVNGDIIDPVDRMVGRFALASARRCNTG